MPTRIRSPFFTGNVFTFINVVDNVDDDDGFIAYVVAGVAGPLRLMLWGYIQEEKTL